jgi:hypothetical protein
MLIIAKKSEKDYYDGVVGTVGVDKTIVYDREIIEIEADNMPDLFKRKTFYASFREREDNPFYQLSNSRLKKKYHKQYPHNSYFILGFCGKLYIGWKLYSIKESTNRNSYNYDFNNVITTITYDLDYIKELFEEKTWHGNLYDNLNYISNYDAMDWFRNMKAPVFIYDYDYDRTHVDVNRYGWEKNNSKFFINPLLKDYEFYKIFDAFQAFQEISMFLGGVLGRGEKDIIEVADKYKIEQHGFDKWSFRKEPEKK